MGERQLWALLSGLFCVSICIVLIALIALSKYDDDDDDDDNDNDCFMPRQILKISWTFIRNF